MILCPHYYYAPPVWRLSVAYIRPKSRTEVPRKTKIGIEVAHVTRESDTTFKVKRSKVKVTGRGILWRPPAQLVMTLLTIHLLYYSLFFYRHIWVHPLLGVWSIWPIVAVFVSFQQQAVYCKSACLCESALQRLVECLSAIKPVLLNNLAADKISKTECDRIEYAWNAMMYKIQVACH